MLLVKLGGDLADHGLNGGAIRQLVPLLLEDIQQIMQEAGQILALLRGDLIAR
jgi:hypothetical protein